MFSFILKVLFFILIIAVLIYFVVPIFDRRAHKRVLYLPGWMLTPSTAARGYPPTPWLLIMNSDHRDTSDGELLIKAHRYIQGCMIATSSFLCFDDWMRHPANELVSHLRMDFYYRLWVISDNSSDNEGDLVMRYVRKDNHFMAYTKKYGEISDGVLWGMLQKSFNQGYSLHPIKGYEDLYQ